MMGKQTDFLVDVFNHDSGKWEPAESEAGHRTCAQPSPSRGSSRRSARRVAMSRAACYALAVWAAMACIAGWTVLAWLFLFRV
jgi:hypothetical protein